MLEKISTFWNTLSRRDRRLMVFMVVSITLFVGYFVVTGIGSRVDRLETTVATKQRDLDTIRMMVGSLEENRSLIAELEEQLAGYADFSVSGFLESTGEQIKISDNIKGINDQGATEGEFFAEHRYEVVLKKVSLEQLVNYLYKIQSAPQPLRVERLVVRANTRNREELNVNVDVVFAKLNQEG